MMMTDEPRGIRQINQSIDEFYFDSIGDPGTHRTGNLKVGRFMDGVWVRGTTITASTLTQRLHKLYLYTGDPGDDPAELRRKQHRYHVTELNVGRGGPLRLPLSLTGIDAMAAAPYDITHDLTKLETVVEYEWADRWSNHKLITLNDEQYANEARRRAGLE